MVNFGGVSGEKLRQMIAKLEKLAEEKREVSEYITDTFKEAKTLGFDVKALREVLKIRRADAQKLAEQQEIIDLYKHALGMADQEEAA